MKTSVKALLVVSMLGFSCQALAQQSKPTYLTNAELKSLLSKKLTVRISGLGDRPGTAPRSGTSIYEPDGTARFQEGNNMITGSWKIDGNRFCSNYTQLGSGCYNVQKTGDGAYRLDPTDSKLGATWQVVK